MAKLGATGIGREAHRLIGDVVLAFFTKTGHINCYRRYGRGPFFFESVVSRLLGRVRRRVWYLWVLVRPLVAATPSSETWRNHQPLVAARTC